MSRNERVQIAGWRKKKRLGEVEENKSEERGG